MEAYSFKETQAQGFVKELGLWDLDRQSTVAGPLDLEFGEHD